MSQVHLYILPTVWKRLDNSLNFLLIGQILTYIIDHIRHFSQMSVYSMIWTLLISIEFNGQKTDFDQGHVPKSIPMDSIDSLFSHRP